MQQFGRAARDSACDGEANRLGNLFGGEAVVGGAPIEDDAQLGRGRVVKAELVDMPGRIAQGGEVGRAHEIDLIGDLNQRVGDVVVDDRRVDNDEVVLFAQKIDHLLHVFVAAG